VQDTVRRSRPRQRRLAGGHEGQDSGDRRAEWSATRRTRGQQVLARWLNQRGGPNVAHSVKLPEQAPEEATRTDNPRRRRPRSPVRALPDSHSPGSDQVPASITPASITPIRRRWLAARAPFAIIYAHEGWMLAEQFAVATPVTTAAERLWTARVVHTTLEEGLAKIDMAARCEIGEGGRSGAAS
jgi:hypothetical protein